MLNPELIRLMQRAGVYLVARCNPFFSLSPTAMLVVALTGGLIGDRDEHHDYGGSLLGTPLLLGCSDRDPHVPLWRVDESEEVFRRMGANVEKRIYPGMAHTVVRDELDDLPQPEELPVDLVGGGHALGGRYR